MPVPTDELVGQLWLLEAIIAGDTEIEPAGGPATMLLNEGGTVEGSTGCRLFTGEYIVTDTAVVFTNFGMGGECPLQLADQDDSVVSVLGDGFTARVDGDRLTLTSTGGEGLRYRAVDEIPEAPPTGDDTACDGIIQIDAIDVDYLLDTQPDCESIVSGHLVDNGGGWYLCATLTDDAVPLCSGRWGVITNMDDDLLTQLGPTTAADEFRTVIYTEDRIAIAGNLLEDGRSALSGTDSGVERTSDDEDLLRAYTDLDPSSPDPAALRISPDGATLSLADALVVQRSFDELADPANWALDLEAFRGRVGPFSALELLGNGDKVTFTAGPHDHCAAPQAPVPEELRDLRQVSIQPTGIDSCLAWWTIDLFVNDEGEVIGVVLDTWEP